MAIPCAKHFKNNFDVEKNMILSLNSIEHNSVMVMVWLLKVARYPHRWIIYSLFIAILTCYFFMAEFLVMHTSY